MIVYVFEMCSFVFHMFYVVLCGFVCVYMFVICFRFLHVLFIFCLWLLMPAYVFNCVLYVLFIGNT